MKKIKIICLLFFCTTTTLFAMDSKPQNFSEKVNKARYARKIKNYKNKLYKLKEVAKHIKELPQIFKNYQDTLIAESYVLSLMLQTKLALYSCNCPPVTNAENEAETEFSRLYRNFILKAETFQKTIKPPFFELPVIKNMKK